MKIGILTIPFNNNYGGYLQSFALMSVLKQMGHEPTLIMRRHLKKPFSFVGRVKYFVKGVVKTIIKRKSYPCIYNVENTFWRRGKEIQTFLNTYIQPQTKYIYTTDELRYECYGKFDAIIVGSDQIWRSIYVPGFVGNMYLDFTKGWNVKRISYAASFGTDFPEYTQEEKDNCGRLISQFDAVSVREESGLKVFDDFNWNVKDPKVVLDPTLLLTKEDYNRILLSKNEMLKGKIFCYVLDKNEETQCSISDIMSRLNKQIYEISDIQKGDSVLPSIEFWLSAIRDSDFVITDSFHGTVFSIIFNKPFVVCLNKSRGNSRFVNLLEQFGLSDNIYSTTSDIKRIYNKDWTDINRIIKEKSDESKLFIINSITSNKYQ